MVDSVSSDYFSYRCSREQGDGLGLDPAQETLERARSTE
jgi:hypothetical protein